MINHDGGQLMKFLFLCILANIFDKFYKSKLRQNAKGSGLGLTIAREIATKHGGTITVNSELGKGTEFVFNFHAGCS